MLSGPSLASRARSWLREEHAGPNGNAIVHGRRIYILPTRYGLLFGALLFLMLIGSLNYDNNPAYLLTFLLIGLSLNAMLQTWRNLRGIQLRMLPGAPSFAGETRTLRFELSASDQRPHYAVSLQLHDQAVVEDIGDNPLNVQLDWRPEQRGWQQPGQALMLATRYPLGLFRAWCRVRLDDAILIYPKPDTVAAPAIEQATEQAGDISHHTSGSEDFGGLREYRTGDTARQIDWKSLARERGLMAKQFHDPRAPALRLDWQSLLSHDHELRLSQLTRAVLDAEQAAQAYGLHLPGKSLGPDLGREHQHQCLRALALFETAP